MPASSKMLTALTIPRLPQGRHLDGDGLYLDVVKAGRRYWQVVLSVAGRRTEMRLGEFPAMSIAAAREARAEAKKLARAGVDPLEGRRAQVTAKRVEAEAAATKRKRATAAKAAAETEQPRKIGRPKLEQVEPEPLTPGTFGHFADQLIDDLRDGWRGKKTEAGWRLSLGVYAAPLRPMALEAITTDDVMGALRANRLWSTKPETAQKAQMRIAAVLDAAIATGKRLGPNPARWDGHLSKLLPKRRKLTRGHHRALPYTDAPALLERIREMVGGKARALEFLLLTVGRTGEVREAPWSEIDMDAQTWTIPAERMKEPRQHVVPLTPGMLAVLRAQREAQGGRPRPTARVFQVEGRNGQLGPLDYNALDSALKKAGAWGGTTVHGLRSTFSDWCGEETDHARETREAALAHVIGDEAERAYRRGMALRKRRLLIIDWEAYLEGRLPLGSEFEEAA